VFKIYFYAAILFFLLFNTVTAQITNKSGLVFEKDTANTIEKGTYTNILQLKNTDAKIQALQFKLAINESIDDSAVIIFRDIQKGTDINNPDWELDYNIIHGIANTNGASQDEIIVLLYNTQQNNGLSAGSHNQLLKIKYSIVELKGQEVNVKSSLRITETVASTNLGFPVNITPSKDDLTIVAGNKQGNLGDLTNDRELNILDLTKLSGIILNKVSLKEDEFIKADIAPWLNGDSAPSPDGLLNVQDITLLRNLILSGVFPDGTSISDSVNFSQPQSCPGESCNLKIYINNSGITIYSDSKTEIKGVQIEFENFYDDQDWIDINTSLGKGYFNKTTHSLKVLLYDQDGIKTEEAGKNFLADIAAHISNPENIKIKNLVIVDKNNNSIRDKKTEVIYGTPGSLPQGFCLYQNYPNPFNPTTTIQYSIPTSLYVTLKLYDVLGNEIKTLVNEEKSRGIYSVFLNSDNLASGFYVYKLEAGNFSDSKKLILLK
jgi:Secretion system C-terminal sorting domain